MDVEICCGDLISLIEAKEGGAKRVELCYGLSEGGLTPPSSLIRKAAELGIPEINVLIRPRGGDFLYSSSEIELMKEDIKDAISAGATGIVTGVLTKEGYIDKDLMRIFINTAHDKALSSGLRLPEFTFHRAFDMSVDPLQSLDDIIELECDTVLTSGMASNALDGISVIKNLVDMSAGKVKIMAGSGITADNAPFIIAETGVHLIHSTARHMVSSHMTFKRKDVNMSAKSTEEYFRMETSREIVAKLIAL